MPKAKPVGDDTIDATADAEIDRCLNLDKPKSFFLFAGAGSGKTRSLTIALEKVLESSHEHLRLHHQKVAVITYTNAACDEILRRVQYSPLVKVLTIHSFVWSQIEKFQADIKMWLEQSLQEDITKLEEEDLVGRAGTKASLNRQRSIQSKKERLANLLSIKRFTYNPNGNNVRCDSLNHAEVIALGASFLTDKPLMQHVLVNAFPILLVDESQDTHGPFMEALLKVQATHKDRFVLGLIGDTMQRIYGHGMAELGQNVPPDWATPTKSMNHRSARRIVRLVNRIRQPVDGRAQRARSDKGEGIVRLFIAASDSSNPDQTELNAKARMAEITGDDEWSSPRRENKMLILEHHMAARRLGFSELFEPLYRIDQLKTALLDGTLPGLRLFSEQVLPVVRARQRGDELAVATILRKHSDLLSKQSLVATDKDQTTKLRKASDAVDDLVALWENGNEPRFAEVFHIVAETELFPIPESLRLYTNRAEPKLQQEVSTLLVGAEIEDEEESANATAWESFLGSPFEQIVSYRDYVRGLATFDTHQGVKGREFDRVMVIIDDTEARGFMFSYDKLFGTKDKTTTDVKNELENKETGIDRTRRLLYVTCSRAIKSLVLVLYTPNLETARTHVISEEWFSEKEIEIL